MKISQSTFGFNFHNRNNGKAIFTIMPDYSERLTNISTPVSRINLKSSLVASRFEKAVNMKHQSQYWSKADVITLKAAYR